MQCTRPVVQRFSIAHVESATSDGFAEELVLATGESDFLHRGLSSNEALAHAAFVAFEEFTIPFTLCDCRLALCDCRFARFPEDSARNEVASLAHFSPRTMSSKHTRVIIDNVVAQDHVRCVPMAAAPAELYLINTSSSTLDFVRNAGRYAHRATQELCDGDCEYLNEVGKLHLRSPDKEAHSHQIAMCFPISLYDSCSASFHDNISEAGFPPTDDGVCRRDAAIIDNCKAQGGGGPLGLRYVRQHAIIGEGDAIHSRFVSAVLLSVLVFTTPVLLVRCANVVRSFFNQTTMDVRTINLTESHQALSTRCTSPLHILPQDDAVAVDLNPTRWSPSTYLPYASPDYEPPAYVANDAKDGSDSKTKAFQCARACIDESD